MFVIFVRGIGQAINVIFVVGDNLVADQPIYDVAFLGTPLGTLCLIIRLLFSLDVLDSFFLSFVLSA